MQQLGYDTGEPVGRAAAVDVAGSLAMRQDTSAIIYQVLF